MALFQDFSFSKPSSRTSHYDEIAPLENLRGSRSPSPFSSTPSSKRPSISDPSFILPSLTDSSIYSSAPISSRLLGADRRRNSLAREYFETIRARRQCAVRQQCDPRRASAIRLYVENLMSEEVSCPELHPSSVGMDFPSPRRSAPSYSEESSRASTEDDDDEVVAMKGLSIMEKSSNQRTSPNSSISSRKRASVHKNVKIKARVSRY